MPAVDPNVYALSIQLQLDSQEAFSTLDQFGESITAVEEQMAAAADKALQNINNIVQQIETSLTHVTDLIGQMDMGAGKVATSLDTINRSTTDSQKTTEEDLDNLIKQRDLWEEVVEFYDEITDSLTKHLKMHTQDVKLLDKIHAAILTKNTGHDNQNNLIDVGNQGIQRGTQLIGQQRDAVKSIADMWKSVWGAVAGFFAYFEKVDQGTEAFVQTNYRAYGSQQKLLQSTRQLTIDLGVSAETAIATYKALADVRTPREEIEKYAQVVAMANRTTGANIETLALYTKRLSIAGFTSSQVSAHVANLTEAMRKFGLNQHDVNAIIRDTSISAEQMRLMFGGSQEQVQRFEQLRGTMAGFGRQMGHSAEQTNAFFGTLTSNVGAMNQFQSFSNTTIKTAEDWDVAFLRAGLRITDIEARWEEAVRTGRMSIAQMNLARQQMINVTFAGNTAAYESAKAMGKEARAIGVTTGTIDDYNRVMRTLANNTENQYAESMNALYASLQALKNTFGAVLGSIAQFVADGLVPLIKFVTILLKIITYIPLKIIEFLNWFENTVPVLGKFVTILKVVVAGLLLAGVIFLAVSGGISAFSFAVGSASSIVTGAMRVVTSMAQAMVTIAGAIGQSIVIILQSLGQGLAALGQAIRPVMVPLLALGLALLMVGIAAWMFAQAVKTVAEVGWAAIPAIIGLVVAIAVLGLVLVGLGMLAQGPVAVGILIVAAAILLVGLAAMLMGLGIMWAAQGLQIMAEIISVGLIMQLPMLALGLILLGSAGLVATPGLILLGIALLFVGLGLMLMAPALALLSTALENLSGAKLLEVAVGFLQASLIFIAAAAIAIVAATLMIPAGILLLIGAILLYEGVRYIDAAAQLMLAIGGTLMSAATAISTSMWLLLEAAILTFVVGILFVTGGLMMAVGAMLLMAAAGIIFGAAFALMFVIPIIAGVATALLAATIPIYIAATMMVMAGMLMNLAGTLFITSGMLLMASAAYLYMAGGMMIVAGGVLIAGSILLIIASAWLFEASLAMLMAGIMILPGSYMIYLGLSWLEMAISRFAKTIDQIKIVGEGMLKLSTAFAMMRDAPVDKLKDAAADALSALLDIDKLADGLDQVSGKLAESTRRFARPANELAEILERLGAAISQFGEGLSLAEDVSQLADMLDQYAYLLEGAADRIETAVQTRAVPAMRAAEQAGLEEAVRSEAITTVQVMTDSEGENESPGEMVALATAQLLTLRELTERVTEMQSGGTANPIGEILTLLQLYLPDIARKDQGLSTEFNAWAK